jgi:uncharacterized protein YegL
MKKNYTKIVFVVDRSGSMGNIAKDIIGGYNKFIADQKALNHGTCDVSFYQFDNVYEAVYENTPLLFVKDLDEKTYIPRGGTALLDAVGRTIDQVGNQLAALKEEQRPEKVLVVIITDGEENSSHFYNSEKIKQMVTHQCDKYKWAFTYIGANQDAWAVGNSMGINATSNLTWASNSKGTANAFSSLNNATACYRSVNNAQYSYSVADVNLQVDAGAKIDVNKINTIFNNSSNTKPVATP